MKQFVDENNYPLFDGLVGLKQNPMKTAMQKLLEILESKILPCDDDNSYVYGMNVAHANLIYNIKNGFLEKEKEQIIMACNANLNGLLTNGKDYYDLNFNHHIKSEPNTYTNFTPHDANAVAEYNKGLKNFTSIQLPSDEDIKKQSKKVLFEVGINNDLYNEGINEGFFLGVEYIKEQILNQNK